MFELRNLLIYLFIGKFFNIFGDFFADCVLGVLFYFLSVFLALLFCFFWLAQRSIVFFLYLGRSIKVAITRIHHPVLTLYFGEKIVHILIKHHEQSLLISLSFLLGQIYQIINESQYFRCVVTRLFLPKFYPTLVYQVIDIRINVI